MRYKLITALLTIPLFVTPATAQSGQSMLDPAIKNMVGEYSRIFAPQSASDAQHLAQAMDAVVTQAQADEQHAAQELAAMMTQRSAIAERWGEYVAAQHPQGVDTF